MAAITICSDFGAKKKKSVTTSTFPPSICHAVEGGYHDLTFFIIYSEAFSFTLIKMLLISLRFLSLEWYHPCTWGCWCSSHLSLYPSRITALPWWRCLHNSMKSWAMPSRTSQDGWVIAESSDQTWYTGGGNGKALQYARCENLMNCIKGQKVMRDDS